MAKLLIDFIDKIDKVSHKLFNGNNGHYLSEITADRLCFERSLQGITSETASDSKLDVAIKKAQTHLLNSQDKGEGYWAGILEGDVALTAEYLMLMHFINRVNKTKQEKAIKYIIEKQEKDGGWSIYHDGHSDISISVKCYFALELAGHSEEEPFMKKARDCILNMGGIMKCNTFTKIYLAIFGQFDWRGIPALPVEIILLPNSFYFNIYEISYWSRCIVIPLGIIMANRPEHKVGDDAALDELYVMPKEKVSYRLDRDHNKFSIKNIFINLDTILRRYEKRPFPYLRKIAVEKAEKWILQRLEKSGGLGAIWPAMVNSVMALKCLGYDNGTPALEKAIEEIEKLAVHGKDTMFLQPCVSPVWDTPWAILALLKSGLPKNHPALVKAGQWLLGKEVKSIGDWSLKNPVKEPSGWYFQHANEFYPDNDDAAVVMMALQLLDLPDKDEKRKAIFRGFRWLMGMQCDDGGWGSFDKNNNKEILNHIPFADWNALLDPSTSDLTARVLDLMGKLGYDLSFPPAKRAYGFLMKEQEKDGSWFGRWGTNYVYGTWSVLSGLYSIKEDMTKDYVKKAASWLKNVQNGDGGWGETCKSYWDTSLSAIGKSTASQTSWAVLGLLCTEERDSESVRKGIEYLIMNQKEDGTWDEEEFTGTGFPKVFYLRYHMYRSYFPLLALSKYRNMVK
ncbi:MAG: squalene-hopene cyclase [Candidatus Scalindua rubra]|uniref:Squalene-hopene cyclase n=1 Tax=Candidatus Scalindua rubra TaxID=1872076 RepID=A0A1E3X7G4_9BACT|nr:MAG: squalene-hopene cyclase [Candidatus Scalindua rubra]